MSDFFGKTYNTRIVIVIITMLAVYPAVFMNASKQNIILLAIMGVSPMIWLFYRFIVPRIDIPFITMYVLMFVAPMVFHPTTMRWSTLLYTGMYISLFLAYVKVLKRSNIDKKTLLNILKYIIYAYCIVLIIQQFCFFAGFPIFNAINIDIDNGFPRLNSIGPEPSWAARNICLITFVYVCLYYNITEEKLSLKEFFKNNKWVSLSFLWVIVTGGSATGIILSLLVIFKFSNWKSILLILSSIILIFSIGKITGNQSIERFSKFIPAVLTMDEQAIWNADSSGASRIVPTIQVAKHLSLTTLDGLFGYGVDYDTTVVKIPGIKANGGAFSLWINHGAIVMFIFWGAILSICRIKGEPISLLFCIFFLFGGITINLQILWFMLVLFETYKFVTENKTKEKDVILNTN